MELFKWIQLNKIINVNECNIEMPRILSIQNEQYRSQLWLDLCLREFRCDNLISENRKVVSRPGHSVTY